MTNKLIAAVALLVAVGIVCLFGVGIHNLLKRPAVHAGMPAEPRFPARASHATASREPAHAANTDCEAMPACGGSIDF